MYQKVIEHFTSGVTVITTKDQGCNYGLTASAVTSLSTDPPRLLVCINKKAGTCQAISESKIFGVNILNEEQGEVAIQFSRPDTDKFRNIDIALGKLGIPLLNDALAHLECRVIEEVSGGTHSVFIADIQEASAGKGTPLTYYRGKFGRFQEANDELVYRQIRKQVLERDLPVGEILYIKDIASQLDASVQTVYYALKRLVGENLVSREEDGGYTISPLNAKMLNDALDTRCALEIAAIEKTVGSLSDEELSEMRKRVSDTLIQRNSDFVSADSYVEANTSFHDYTVALANNTTLLETYRKLFAEAVMSSALRQAFAANDHTVKVELESLVDDHTDLLQAYEEADVQKATRIIHRHTNETKKLGRYLIDHAGGKI
nr:flavin reductase [Bacillus piscicola]